MTDIELTEDRRQALLRSLVGSIRTEMVRQKTYSVANFAKRLGWGERKAHHHLATNPDRNKLTLTGLAEMLAELECRIVLERIEP